MYRLLRTLGKSLGNFRKEIFGRPVKYAFFVPRGTFSWKVAFEKKTFRKLFDFDGKVLNYDQNNSRKDDKIAILACKVFSEVKPYCFERELFLLFRCWAKILACWKIKTWLSKFHSTCPEDIFEGICCFPPLKRYSKKSSDFEWKTWIFGNYCQTCLKKRQCMWPDEFYWSFFPGQKANFCN